MRALMTRKLCAVGMHKAILRNYLNKADLIPSRVGWNIWGHCNLNYIFPSSWMGGKNACKLRPEAATRSDILYLFGQGNINFLRKNLPGNFETWDLWQPWQQIIVNVHTVLEPQALPSFLYHEINTHRIPNTGTISYLVGPQVKWEI